MREPAHCGALVLLAVLALIASSIAPATLGTARAAGAIQLSRSLAAPGDTVNVSGAGFTPGDTVVVYADLSVGGTARRMQTAVRAGGSGTFQAVLAVPSGTAPRGYTVRAKDFHGITAALTLRILPLVLLTPGAAAPTVTVLAGHRFYVRGSGFGPSETVALSAFVPLYDGNTTTVNKSATTDSHGNFGEVLVQLPGTAKQNTVTFTATGQSSQKKATASLKVTYQPSISLTTDVLRPGAAAVIKGQGFVPGSTVHLSIPVQQSGGPITLTRDVAVDASGSFSVSIALPLHAQQGKYTVSALDTIGNFATSIPLTVTLKPAISLSSRGAAPGQTIKITGGGFSANAPVTISATFRAVSGGNRVVSKTATTDANGSFTAWLTVPGHVMAGQVSVTAKGPNAQAAANLLVSVSSRISVNPGSASPGGAVTVNGAGFSANVTVKLQTTVALYGGGSRTVSQSVHTDAHGSFSTRLSIPQQAAAGTLTIAAVGPNTQASTRLAVGKLLPTVVASPASIIPGGSVNITGSGFLNGVKVDISIAVKSASGAARTLSTSATTDGKGRLSATLRIPADTAGGTYTVVARSTTSGRAPIAHLVVARLAASIVAVPTTAVPGTQVTVNGFGFAAGNGVTVYLGNGKMTTVTTDGSGKFSTRVTIPADSSTGTYTLSAVSATGRKARVNLAVQRQVSTHFYFASFYTGQGYHEYLALLNPSGISSHVTITYQLKDGSTPTKTLTLNAHTRATENVNADLGVHVSAGAVVAADVPISVARMVYHGTDGAIVPGAKGPATSWYFANGNTSGKYREYVALENPNSGSATVNLLLLPTHHRAIVVTRTMGPTSRTTVRINSYVRDAVGVVVTSTAPVVANRTIFIHHGMTSKIGIAAPQRNWYFASGPANSAAKAWIGAINPGGSPSYITLHAYGRAGLERGTAKGWLRPHGRVGYLINRIAHSTDVSVVLTASRPIVAEQTSYANGKHDAATDSFGATSPAKAWQFPAVNTVQASGQADTVELFNPNLMPIPVVLQFMTSSGSVMQRTYVVGPLGHQPVDAGSVAPNTQLGVVAASNYPFVAMNRSFFNNGMGSDTSSGIRS